MNFLKKHMLKIDLIAATAIFGYDNCSTAIVNVYYTLFCELFLPILFSFFLLISP
ncbi:hypothetical protein RCH19_000984 [Flavobacterium sp. PL12]